MQYRHPERGQDQVKVHASIWATRRFVHKSQYTTTAITENHVHCHLNLEKIHVSRHRQFHSSTTFPKWQDHQRFPIGSKPRRLIARSPICVVSANRLSTLQERLSRQNGVHLAQSLASGLQ
jgi:hypothetical protein